MTGADVVNPADFECVKTDPVNEYGPRLLPDSHLHVGVLSAPAL
jgi:hypothetical protein